jgi:hypothetical protein
MEVNLWKILLILGLVLVIPPAIRFGIKIGREIRGA